MKIAISGATGFIGSHLSAFLSSRGHEVAGLTRGDFQEEAMERLTALIAETDVVINLAGAPVNRRWTPAYKEILYKSRILPTRKLTEAVNRTSRVKLFISASAVGYYPSSGCYDEQHGIKGEGFLSDLCEVWEKEALKARSSVRTVITRFGMVLSAGGGAFVQLIRPVRMGIAAVIAPGDQAFAWIGLTDLSEAMAFIIKHPELDGVFNFVVPERITNAGFTAVLARHCHTWLKIKVPVWAFRLLYGEGAGFLTRGQCVSPSRLVQAGFRFQWATAESFIGNL